jgi:disulfide bond formation protein DsbB
MTPLQRANPEATRIPPKSSWLWELLALAVSSLAIVGSLYLTMGMKLKACPLCLYERTFVMALVGVLLIGLLRHADVRPGVLALLCLPLAIGGLGVAGFHTYLERTNVLECPAGVFGLGSAPQQSLSAYCVITTLLGIATVRAARGTAWGLAGFGAVVLGLLFSLAAIYSAPPLPAPPTEPYTSPLDGCRPRFQSPHSPPSTSP